MDTLTRLGNLRQWTTAVLLALVASTISMVTSIYLEEWRGWHAGHPIAHSTIATSVATMVFMAAAPHRSPGIVWVFVPIAFVVIATVSTIVAVVMAMPS